MTNVDGAKSRLRCEKPSMIPSRQARDRGGTRGGMQTRLKAANHNLRRWLSETIELNLFVYWDILLKSFASSWSVSCDEEVDRQLAF